VRIVVLGGGPAGLGAALGLARRGFQPVVVEARGSVGGNAGSFEVGGLRVDYGSHRLHPATDPEILGELRSLLGDDLLLRPRHGRILLGGRWIHFPLRPLDLAVHAPPRFALGVARDLARKALPGARSGEGRRAAGSEGASDGGDTFASVLLRGLGPTICHEFYFPYARKIWGMAPEEISPIQARKRVSAGSIGKLLRRLLPGRRAGGGSPKGIFYYPRHGYGQISEALRDAALEAGAEIRLGSRVLAVELGDGGGRVRVEGPDGAAELVGAHVWSTIPVGPLVRILEPPAPADVLHAASSLELRAMLLVYLVLEQDRFTEYDAHYFPSLDVPMTRLSEPKNYSGRTEPHGRTVLCAEIPCSTDDGVWGLDDRALGELVVAGLARAGLPAPVRVLEVVVRHLPAAYPLYRRGYEAHFDAIDDWLEERPGLLTFGRQGLYAHDNTHHALFMARAAVDCLDDDGRFDRERWTRYREVFAGHVVED
jgi:protoporphyrinogen oxidase